MGFVTAEAQCKQRDGSFTGGACGYVCDDDCNCGHCNNKPGCMSEDTCMSNCNSGANAKWCPDVGPAPAPTPTPSPAPVPTPSPGGQCMDASQIPVKACGYNCDENCNCGRCNTKPGCLSEETCLGTCNGGGNAKWCGADGPAPAPTPPAPTPVPTPPAPTPTPDECPGGNLANCLDLCPADVFAQCAASCQKRCPSQVV